jgi:threonine dehydratase
MQPFAAGSGALAPPTLLEIEAAARRLAPYLEETPVFHWTGPSKRTLFAANTDIWVKLELLQVTGSFKPRGALNVALSIDPAARNRGFATFSSGNNAAAVAYAAQMTGTSAKVVMTRSANPARVANCRRYGAEVIFTGSVQEASERVVQICAAEGRTYIHPYEGPLTSCGNATLALEMLRQIPDLDAIVVAIGGGGLCSGIGTALELARPQCELLAVEPEGADTMFRSFRSGKPEKLEAVRTIADSLAPPHTLPYSFNLCHRTVAELVLISDDQIRAAMACLYRDLKLCVEPGGAAALAGALFPFHERLLGKCVGVIVCGSNIDSLSFHEHVGAIE